MVLLEQSDFWVGPEWNNGILAFRPDVFKNIVRELLVCSIGFAFQLIGISSHFCIYLLQRYEQQQYSRLNSVSVAAKPYDLVMTDCLLVHAVFNYYFFFYMLNMLMVIFYTMQKSCKQQLRWEPTLFYYYHGFSELSVSGSSMVQFWF